MADVDMTDAPSGSTAPVKKSAGKTKAGSEVALDGKKRFEVKKVGSVGRQAVHTNTDLFVVECRSPLGLGYCR